MEDTNLSEIGMYESVEPLREVPEGVLYRAAEKNSGAPVLIKIYYPSLDWSEEILNEFFNLLSYLRFIEHDNLLPILDMGKHNGKPYIVFPGETSTLLHDRPAAPASRAELLGFYQKIASALDFLHKQEILHGSLNTQNILISSNGEPKLFDYGLNGVFKKLLLENLDDGFENLAVADLHCTAPEQIMGRNPSRASDIYAYGMVLYYYTFGGFPIEGKTTPSTALSLLDRQKFEIGDIPNHIPGGALSLLQKCLQPAPEARFASFTPILNALERLQAGKGIRLRYKKRFDTPSKIPRPILWYALTILTLAALFAAYQFYPRQTEITHPSPPAPVSSPQPFPSPTHPPPSPTPSPLPATPSATSEIPPPPTAPASATLKPAVEGEQPHIPVQALSPVNIAQITELARLGYGKPEDADASATNQIFAVAASGGVFIFKENTYLKWIDPQGWATSVQFSTNGDTLAIGLETGEIQLWDWKNETRKAVLSGHTAQVSKLIFSSNDRLLYSASHDQNVIVWDLNQNRIVRKIQAHAVPINDIAISSDGRTLVTCADDQLIRIWDVQVGSKIYEFNFKGKAQAVAISSDNAYFAAGGDSGFIYQWNLINSRSSAVNPLQLRTDPIPAKARIWSLAYINNDTGLLAGLDNGQYTIFNPARKSYTTGLNFVVPPPVKNLLDVFGPKFKFESRAFTYDEKIISINWDGKVTVQQNEILAPAYDILDRLDFSPDGNILAAGGKRGTVNVWNLTTHQVLYRSNVPIPFGDSLAPDGSSIIVLDKKTVRITQSGEHIVEESYRQVSLNGKSVVGGLSESVRGGWVSFARSGTVLVAGNSNQSKTWDYTNGFETYSAWRKDNGCLITTSKNDGETLQILSPAGLLPQWNDLAKRICTKSSAANLPAFSQNLTFMTYVNSNGLIEGFDVETGQSRWRYKPQSRVTALAVSPKGDIVAAGTEKGDLIFLDSKTGSVLATVTGNFKAVRAIKFSDDSIKLATAGDDGVTRVFGIPPSP
jgi:WD40 repeat protein/serine/threonine protein kinase